MLGLHCGLCTFSSCSERELLSSCGAWDSHCGGFSCCGAWAPGHVDFSSCGVWVQKLPITGSRAQAQSLWCMGLVSPWHVVSSQTRDRTRVSCIDRWITNHWTTREAPAFEFREDTIQSTIPAAWKIWDAESNRHLWAETLHSSCWIFLAGVKVSTILGWGGHMDISHRFLLIWHV